jgi:hypothetical protein
MSTEDIDRWSDDRLIPDATKEELSPSGRHRLVMRYYDQGDGYWRYSRGTVYRVSDGAEVADVKRNYSTFHHSFVTKGRDEYLISGRSYMGQTVVNLETALELNDEAWKAEQGYCGFELCWAAHWLSPDGNTLVVNGCVWGGPYGFHFFDFTDPEKGWPQLEQDLDLDEGYGGHVAPDFHEDGTISVGVVARLFKPLGKYEHELTEEEEDALTDEEIDDEELWEDVSCKRVLLRREGARMVVISETSHPSPATREAV